MMRTIVFFCGVLSLLFPQIAFAHEGEAATIHITEDGFAPNEITIDQGSTVVFENATLEKVWPASDIHPTHQIYPEFDTKKPLLPGDSWKFTFSSPGEWTMHDHLRPEFTGKITVKGEQLAEKKSYEKSFTQKVKLSITKTFYKIFPQALEKKLGQINFGEIAKDENEKLVYWLEILGAKKTMTDLLIDTRGGATLDCHQQAHVIGRLSYDLFGAEVFKEGDPACHSGFYHGAMESFLHDKGTADLGPKIDELCKIFTTEFGNFECLHGVGHGVMALKNYDLPRALKTCDELSDSYATSSCYGGVFMENIVAAEGLGASDSHKTNWVSDDPHFPCNGIDQSQDVQYQCYLMQTSRMLDIFNHDFARVAKECENAPTTYKPICYQSLGRDAAGQKLRDPVETLKICNLVPHEFFNSCISGALQVVIDFWGEKMTDQPHKLCTSVASLDGKIWCFQMLGQRLPGIFGADTQKSSQNCEYAGEYKESCLRGARSVQSI